MDESHPPAAPAPPPPSLEDRMAQLEAGLNFIVNKLDNLLPSSASSQPRPAPPPVPPTSPPLAPTATDDPRPPLPRRDGPRPPLPEPFDGAREKGRSFLLACAHYRLLCADAFQDEHHFIRWILSYMNKGRALEWTGRIFSLEALPFDTYEEFEAEFRSRFMVEDESGKALLRLETKQYHQGRRSVVDYIDEFESLISRAGLSDNPATVMKFRHGLEPSLQTAVATQAYPPVSLREWKRAAQRHYEARASNAVFEAATSSKSRPSFFPGAQVIRPPGPSQAPPLPRPAPARPSFPGAPPAPPPGGIPMDVDHSRPRCLPPSACYHCGEIGHIAQECPRARDVRAVDFLVDELARQLSTQELEEALAKARDAAEIEPEGVEDDGPTGFAPDEE